MLSAPEPLASHHPTAGFASGVSSLDEWLRRKAPQNQLSGASRTFVVCDAGEVVAYYALASGAVAAVMAPGSFRRNMPDPIPVVVLGRLAIASTHHGQGIGRALFQDAARRVLQAGESIGVRGLLVHAISEEARNFYMRLGLKSSPLEPWTLMVGMAELRRAVSAS